MKRFVVTRHYIKHKGAYYKQGDLLPVEFTDRDKHRNIYSSRIGVIDVPDAPAVAAPVAPIAPVTATPINTTTPANQATIPSAAGVNNPASSVGNRTGNNTVGTTAVPPAPLSRTTNPQ